MKQLPHSKEAEAGVLSCILKDHTGATFDEVHQTISESDFFTPRNGIIFSVLKDMVAEGKVVDEVVLLEELKAKKPKSKIEAADVVEIGNLCDSPVQASYFAQIVREKSKLRQLIRIANKAAEDALEADDSDRLMARMESDLIELGKQTSEDDTIAKATAEVEKDYQAMMEGNYKAYGLPTHVDVLDEHLLGGMEPGTVTIVSAPTSCGKSQLALNIVLRNAIQHGVAAGYFSFEMPSKQLAKRMLWISSGVSTKYFRERTASAKQQESVKVAAEKLRNTHILTNHNKRQVDELASLARQWKRKHNIGLLVVDYLQLLAPPNSKSSSVESVAYNSRKLKALAMDLDIPLVVMSQVNREAVKALAYKPSRGLFVHDLIGGSAIECDADNVLLFWPTEGHADNSREVDMEGKQYLKLTCEFAKFREGTRGNRFTMKFREQLGRFY